MNQTTLSAKRERKRVRRLWKLKGRILAHGSRSLPEDVQSNMREARELRRLRREMPYAFPAPKPPPDKNAVQEQRWW